MADDLLSKHCLPNHASLPVLGEAEVERLLPQVPGWYLNTKGHLFKPFRFPLFKTGAEFVRRASALADEEYHHPTLTLAYGSPGSYGRVGVEIWTHKLGALSENDFILAAKLERLAGEL
jgi:4a-hydroxytetrahydrobiopterin dehydratase